MSDARTVAEKTARASYGRLLAMLAARSRDIAAAEDALADAFAAALEHWPQSGVPTSPEAWLLTAARRKLIDAGRRAKTRTDAQPALLLALEDAQARVDDATYPDERLKLLFVCAHPAVDPGVRTPLMLQTVLGLDASRIGSAFLVAPGTMGQRLVRAKRKIADAGIPFKQPEPEDLDSRMGAVLDSIYAAFGAGYDSEDGADPRASGLAEEAIYLGGLVAELLPNAAEAHGLSALMLYTHARRNARRVNGRYIALDAQDIDQWDHGMIADAERRLEQAAKPQTPGRYQLEAAIQSAHAAGRLKQRDNSDAIVRLYDRLLDLAPSIGAAVGRAAALHKAGRNNDAMEALAAIPKERAGQYQPYWATLAHICAACGDQSAAAAAYDRAIALSEDPAIRRFLLERKTGPEA